jgi:hypothetical protein
MHCCVYLNPEPSGRKEKIRKCWLKIRSIAPVVTKCAMLTDGDDDILSLTSVTLKSRSNKSNAKRSISHRTKKNVGTDTINDMVQGPCGHLGFKYWDMGMWHVMTNVVLDKPGGDNGLACGKKGSANS